MMKVLDDWFPNYSLLMFHSNFDKRNGMGLQNSKLQSLKNFVGQSSKWQSMLGNDFWNEQKWQGSKLVTIS